MLVRKADRPGFFRVIAGSAGGTLDHDAFRSIRSKRIGRDRSQRLEHDVVRKPLPTFRHHALGRWATAFLLAACLTGPVAAAPVRWQDTVAAGHEARKARLADLARTLAVGTPALHEALVGRAELPASFGIDLPVLRVVFPQNAFFDTDRDDLRPDAEAAVALVAQALREVGGETALFVAGHADARGSDGYNLDLSIRRAEAVARALDAAGTGGAKLWRIGFGRAVPLMPNTTDANRARNRRVEFIIAPRAEAVRAWLVKQDALVCAGSDPATRAGCRGALAAAPRFEAVPVGAAAAAERAMPVVVKVVGVRAPKPAPPAAIRLQAPEPVRVEMGVPQVYVRRPDL